MMPRRSMVIVVASVLVVLTWVPGANASEPTPKVATPTAAPAAKPSAEVAEPPVTATKRTTKTTKRGIYLGFGFGAGGSSLSPDAVAGHGALLFHFRGGTALMSSRLLVGGTITAVTQYNRWKQRSHTGSAISSIMAEATYFPLAKRPLNLAGGVGWGSGLRIDRISDVDGDAGVAADGGNGLSWMGAIGYDLITGDSLNLGLQLRYDGTALADLGTVHAGSVNVMFNFY